LKKLTLSLLLLVLATSLHAEQLSFKKQEKDGQTRFSYKWLDHKNKKQTLDFTLANKTMFSRFRHFKGYKPDRVQRAILVNLQKAAAKLDRKKINVNFVDRNDGIQIQLSSKDQKLIDKTNKMLIAIREKTEKKWLKKYYHNVLVDKFGQSGIKPDHVRIAKETGRDILPLTSAMLKKQPQLKGRQLAEYILGFVQSIPYSTLESRMQSNGAGFSPPLRLLNNNQGDCDSKVTLMANMLRAIYPRIKIVIIYLPNHALIGVQMTHRKNDKWLKLEGREYILAEPTGPGMIPFATVAESSEFFIDGRQFSYESF
jgi:hypothetical protein